jgi:acetyltransferase-like isoleucine patch superfamily enzyme
MKYFIKVFVRFLKQTLSNWKVYKDSGILVPRFGIINGVENISFGRNMTIGTGCRIYAQNGANDNSEIIFGKGVSINYDVSINADCGGKIIIGDNSLIGPGVIIRASNHNTVLLNVPINSQGHIPGRIEIGENVWLGAHVIILPNVRIGNNAIIGAGSVVTKNIPEDVVAVGVPAKVIKQRT